MCGCLSRTCYWGDLAHSPGLCPDGESNQRPFSLQAGAQSIEPHQPGLNFLIKNESMKVLGLIFSLVHSYNLTKEKEKEAFV